MYIDPYGNQYYYEWGNPLCTPQAVSSLGLSLANGGSLNNLNIRNLNTGVQSDGACSATNLQFVQCGAAFDMEYTNLYAGNVLMSYVGLGFAGRNFKATCEHLTFDQGVYLGEDYASGSSSVWLTNSLLTGVSGYGNVTKYTNAVVKLASNAGVYQTVGAGSYYLVTNSPYHSQGTTSINPALRAQLNQKTTYPPIVYSNTTISVGTTFSPQAQRDNIGNPDLGYHYDPIDYFFGGVTAYSNVTFTAGTAFGWFPTPGSSWTAHGISLNNNVVATFNGTVISPCIYANHSTVQEGNGIWTGNIGLGGIAGGGSYDPSNPAQLTARFTRMSNLASGMNFRDGPSGQPLMVHATDCELYEASGGYNLLLAFTNCLFYRGGIGQATADSRYSWETYRETYRNCTFYGGSLNFTHWESPPYWQESILDCAFDGTAFNMPTNGLSCDYNSFRTNAARLPITGAHEVIVSNYNWQSSWFGSFYLPTNSPLIGAGDRTADLVGLYHYTTLTNQVVEGNSTVDIGYHYVANDQYGNPFDSNGNGVPDYIEDSNGNGLINNDETPWTSEFKVRIVQPKSNTVLP